MYKIEARNDETGSTYIKGEYFVRNTGVANIAGASFKYSGDGRSFQADMFDSQDKFWGNLDGSG